MNIFVIDADTARCARALDDLRLNKMIVETAQILSTVMRTAGYKGDDIYKSTHKNHPCVLWAGESTENYKWLLLYMSDLVEEKYNRTQKHHKSYEIFNTLCGGAKLLPQGPMTPFVNCTPHKNLPTIEAYRLTLIEKWTKDKKTPTWKNSSKPIW